MAAPPSISANAEKLVTRVRIYSLREEVKGRRWLRLQKARLLRLLGTDEALVGVPMDGERGGQP